ncbi:MAG: hypothetical protein IJL54_04570 [Prevotella sp.]|nr:hypothetical protein [Prevotella sp.]
MEKNKRECFHLHYFLVTLQPIKTIKQQRNGRLSGGKTREEKPEDLVLAANPHA